MVVASTIIFGFSNVLAKWSMVDYPVGEALFIRSVAALANQLQSRLEQAAT